MLLCFLCVFCKVVQKQLVIQLVQEFPGSSFSNVKRNTAFISLIWYLFSSVVQLVGQNKKFENVKLHILQFCDILQTSGSQSGV